MSSTIGADLPSPPPLEITRRGIATTIGLFPNATVLAPHGGRFGSVFVQHMAANPASAACHPYVPARIQWDVSASATHPSPCSRASSIARCIAPYAARFPGPRRPVQRSIAPNPATFSGPARGSINPLRTCCANRGRRATPCVRTPSRSVSAVSRAPNAALAGATPNASSTSSILACSSANAMRLIGSLAPHVVCAIQSTHRRYTLSSTRRASSTNRFRFSQQPAHRGHFP